MLLATAESPADGARREGDGPSNFDQPPSNPLPNTVPQQFCGTWSRHGAQIRISCNGYDLDNPFAPNASNVQYESRVYTWCIEPGTRKRNPPPCDTTSGNTIINGFYEFLQADATDPNANVLTAVSLGQGDDDPRAGTSTTFTLEPGPLLVAEGGFKFCREDTDPEAGRMWCGA
jgi:hypothetical protein